MYYNGIFQIIFPQIKKSKIFSMITLNYLKEIKRNSLSILFDPLILQTSLGISAQSYTIVHIKLAKKLFSISLVLKSLTYLRYYRHFKG